jgi:hypothetical protein
VQRTGQRGRLQQLGHRLAVLSRRSQRLRRHPVSCKPLSHPRHTLRSPYVCLILVRSQPLPSLLHFTALTTHRQRAWVSGQLFRCATLALRRHSPAQIVSAIARSLSYTQPRRLGGCVATAHGAHTSTVVAYTSGPPQPSCAPLRIHTDAISVDPLLWRINADPNKGCPSHQHAPPQGAWCMGSHPPHRHGNTPQGRPGQSVMYSPAGAGACGRAAGWNQNP